MPKPSPAPAEERRRRGRPPLPAEERRDRRAVVRLTAAEVLEVADRAASARLAPAVYMRRRALAEPVRRVVVQRLGAAERRELNRIGVNLNQIARALNAGAAAPAGTRAAVPPPSRRPPGDRLRPPASHRSAPRTSPPPMIRCWISVVPS